MGRMPSIVTAILLAGCASKTLTIPGPLGGLGERPATHRTHSPQFGDAIAVAARRFLIQPPKGFRADCSGFVSAALVHGGVGVTGTTATLWQQSREARWLHRRRTPRVGDLAFFDNTWDRNDNGKLDDSLTHVAVVISVDGNGTATLAQAGTSGGRSTLQMNLHRPSDVHLEATQINGFLRRRTPSDPPGTSYLASELWRGFATVRPSGFAASNSPELQGASVVGGATPWASSDPGSQGVAIDPSRVYSRNSVISGKSEHASSR